MKWPALLVGLEPAQAKLLEKICSDSLISGNDLRSAGTLEVSAKSKKSKKVPPGPDLFDHAESK
jgi:hypothetical protein